MHEQHHVEQHVIHGVTVPFGRLIRDAIRNRNNQQQEQIMATLQEVVDATARNGAAARAAIVRVNADLAQLKQMITDLQATIAASGDAAAKLAATETGLSDVVASIDALTLEESALDAPPAPPA